MQQPEPFWLHFIGQACNPRGVAARAVDACRETLPDRIATDGEHVRYGPGHSLRRQRRRLSAGRRDHGYRQPHQFVRHRRQLIVLAKRETIFDGHVASIDVVALRQAPLERGDKMRCVLARPGAEIPDHRHRWLLRARGERPRSRGRRRADDKRNELAAPHSITSLARATSTSDKETPSNAAALRLTAM